MTETWYFFKIIQRVKARAILCPHQPPTKVIGGWWGQSIARAFTRCIIKKKTLSLSSLGLLLLLLKLELFFWLRDVTEERVDSSIKRLEARRQALVLIIITIIIPEIQRQGIWHYESRKGERGLASIEDSVDALIQLEWLITATRNNTNNTRINRTTITRKQKWEEKLPYGHFKRQIIEISHEKTWLRKGNLKRETESLLIGRHKD